MCSFMCLCALRQMWMDWNIVGKHFFSSYSVCFDISGNNNIANKSIKELTAAHNS